MFLDRAMSAIFSMGCNVPTSLFECMMLISLVFLRMAFLISSGSTKPCRSTPTVVISKPIDARYAAGL